MNKKMKEYCKKKKENSEYCNIIPYYALFRPITVLLGPNKCGKSETIENIELDLKDRDIDLISYRASKDDSFSLWSMNVLIPKLLKERYRELYILIDDIDSYMSLDSIYRDFESIVFILKKEIALGRNIHFIISARTYELADIFRVFDYLTANYIWTPTGESIILGSYRKYKKRFFEYYEEMNKQ